MTVGRCDACKTVSELYLVEDDEGDMMLCLLCREEVDNLKELADQLVTVVFVKEGS